MIADLADFIRSNKFKTVGIVGNAASGKTTLSRKIEPEFYSVDFRFIGDSDFRKRLLSSKAHNLDDYLDACNMYNWWDWDLVETDINNFIVSGKISLSGYYDRDTGHTIKEPLVVSPSCLVVDGAILGPLSVLDKLEALFFVYTEPSERFNRLVSKDIGRRSFGEIVARFLVTEYSENLYYASTLKYYDMLFVDKDYNLIAKPKDWVVEHQFLPLDLGKLP